MPKITTPPSSPSKGQTLKALESLLERFIALSKKIDQKLPSVEWDKQWDSKCIVDSTPDNQGLVHWTPTKRPHENIFSAMEQALNVEFHPDILTFYSSYWSDGLVVSHETGEISLIQIWNQQDEEMLKENILGHAFAKKKNRLPLTVFIGCTYDDQIVAVDNDSGSIVIERAGFASHTTLAGNMTEFLDSLTPTLKPYNN